MGVTVRDVQSSFMKARTRYKESMGKTKFEFYRPMYDEQLALLWRNFPPEIKEQLKMMNPSAYKEVAKKIGE